jgi:alpha-L-rhamnosidase
MVYNHGTKIFKEDWGGGMVQMPPLGGSLGWWFYYSLAGIRPDPDGPGFRKILIRPDMVPGLTQASGEYRSVSGLIRSEWKRDKDRLTLEIDIPANTTATVYLPAADPGRVSEGGRPVAGRSEFGPATSGNGQTIIRTGSGHYLFSISFEN